ncbi:MAG TPA: UMP kinase [Treponemataceae bacterium]|jgi:uridylate kinase|nr:MAG: Uridylate kinase [Spirochaetes bacterium ADurb.Bin269]TAH46537.1 MAG: UMP kinase [Treponema sp.]HOC29199.1 UMP kinase [Treponemataceae bacterium]HQL32307.1 UMP kinase [Treponemataceae bacterium]
MVTVLSLGGSIVAPDKPDPEFLSSFVRLVRQWLAQDNSRKLILVVGGGGPARAYQSAYKAVVPDGDNDQADWIGIMATRLNAQLLKAIFADICPGDVVYDPTKVDIFAGRILVAAGWKPGFSTDNDAVYLAERFDAQTVINLSNIAKVYTDDPRNNPEATPIDSISWADFRKIVGDEWIPGKNVPFDPVASIHAQKAGISVICAAGRDIENLSAILDGKPFTGTTITG